MELNEMTAEHMIAALVASNGGVLKLSREKINSGFDGMLLQVSEEQTTGNYTIRLVESGDVELGDE